jgi:Na+/H+-dicarboxylate symporter
MHDVSMLYTFILWAVIGGILALLFVLKVAQPSPGNRGNELELENCTAKERSNTWYRAWRGAGASLRRLLLPESCVGFFGNITRLQLLVLAILLSYLLIFS